METKICTKCKKELLATTEFFHKKGTSKDGLCSWCKKCRSEQAKQRYKLNCEWILECNRRWREDNSEYYKQRYEENREQKLEQAKEYYRENRDERLKYQKKRQKTSKGKEVRRKAKKKHYNKHKLSNCISDMIRRSLKGNKNGRHWENLVGYTLKQLKQHLESLFQPEMSWENHSQYGWHIDHKIPISSFNITSYDCEDFEKCWALENLQPLWAEENWLKSNSLDWKK